MIIEMDLNDKEKHGLEVYLQSNHISHDRKKGVDVYKCYTPSFGTHFIHLNGNSDRVMINVENVGRVKKWCSENSIDFQELITTHYEEIVNEQMEKIGV